MKTETTFIQCNTKNACEDSVDFNMNLKPHVQHHRCNHIEVWKAYPQPPSQLKENDQSPCKPFRKYSIGTKRRF